MWNPFTQNFNTYPHQQVGQSGSKGTQSPDEGKIELPGGGFIQKPASELQRASGVHAIKIEQPEGGFIQKPGLELKQAPAGIELPGGGFIQKPGSEPQQAGIELPGGGFIQKPGSEPKQPPVVHAVPPMYFQYNPVPIPPYVQADEFETPEERLSLMNKLEMMLEEREERKKELDELCAQGKNLEQTLYKLNVALDFHTSEMTELKNTLRKKKEQMKFTIQSKRTDNTRLRGIIQQLQLEETKTASYKVIATESKFLKEQVSKATEERKFLKKKIDELDHKADEMELRSKIIEQEEITLEKNLIAYVQQLAGNGELKQQHDSSRYEFDEEPDSVVNTITVQDQTHPAPQESSLLHPLHEVTPQISETELAEQPTINEADQQVEEIDDSETIEVLEDNGALRPKVKKGGFFSRLRRVFRRKPKQGSGREKRGKKEVQRNKKCINDPEPTEVVTEVIEKKDTDLHLTAELEGETSAQEMNECNETVTRL